MKFHKNAKSIKSLGLDVVGRTVVGEVAVVGAAALSALPTGMFDRTIIGGKGASLLGSIG
jgi:hypothetical protein